jgi:GTP-binding protein Era
MVTDQPGMNAYRCGNVTILGRPNVGKSTLLNQLIEQKISITSRKPQTTRNQILGIRTQSNYQAVYIDTPGLQKTYDTPVHRYMNTAARNSLLGVDLVIFMIEALKWTDEDEMVLKMIVESKVPMIVAINKVDKLKDKSELLPFIKKLSNYLDGIEYIPISAIKGTNLLELEKAVFPLLPEGPPMYSDESITNKSKRFFAAEFIREKLINRLGDELPYRIAVNIEEFTEEETIIWLKAIVWVEGKSQKNIVVGKNGIILKTVGEAARLDLEKMFEKKIHLKTWVKVKKNWTMSKNIVEQLWGEGDKY